MNVVFGALSDPTRRAVVARLAEGETPLTLLAEPFDMTLPAVSKHVRVLIAAGLRCQQGWTGFLANLESVLKGGRTSSALGVQTLR